MALAGLPRTSRLVTKDQKLDEDWDQYLQSVIRAINATSQQSASVSDTAVTASVSATDFPTSAALPSGLYRVTYSQWITVADGVSSSLTCTVSWENEGQTFSQSGAAMTGNTLTTQQNGAFTFNIDASTMVSYAFTYVSGGGGPAMAYAYDVRLEQLP